MKTNRSFMEHKLGISYNIIRTVGTAAVIILLAIISTTLVPIHHEPNSAKATAGIPTAPTLTFTSINTIASVNLAINSVNGTFATSSETQKAAFSISTNNYTGYTLNITASDDATTLNDNYSHTIASISSSTPLANFQDASSTGQALNNRWGFIPNYYNSTANTTNYYPAPTSANVATLRVTDSANAADGTSNPDIYTIGLGLRADYTNPSGTYTNSTFIIQYVANTIDYIITYSADGITDVNNLPATQGGSSTPDSIVEESVLLSSSVPTRPGYTFTGWCLGTLSNNGTTCTGTTFAAGASFGIDKTVDNSNITLKALWIANTYAITFTFDNTKGVSDIVIKDATGTNTIATISATGGSTNLTFGTTYTIVPTIDANSGYELGEITIASGAGTLSGTSPTNYTVGVGIATINVATVKPIVLYNEIATMSKGKQTAADLQVAITAPTSSDPSTDTSNSGVYEYDPSVFGATSDASNDYTIYYYRGILDSNLDGTSSTYGSNGNGAYYPNYVRLNDTCWRIVRTTGSGGIKMIYNGLYSSGTTANSCANATTDAQTAKQAFGIQGNSTDSTHWDMNINRVGYTFNNTQNLQDVTTDTSVDIVFGSNADPSLNNTRSNIKDYVEDTWYVNSLTAYTSMLEASAGYCSDRTVYSDEATSISLAIIPPYGASYDMYFGAYGRNLRSATKTPSLNCPRSTVDLYRYVANSAGVSNELKYPVALLTADEASFAGSGNNNTPNGSTHHANSFLRSGSSFWLLSPHGYGGGAGVFNLYSSGYIDIIFSSNTSGVRPVISLASGTIAASGSGTATDPWVVTAP